MNPHLFRLRWFSLRNVLAALCVGWLGAAPLAPAQVDEYEGFEYTGTALNGQNGGTGWGANAWTDPDGNAPLSDDGVSLAFPPSVNHAPAGSRLLFAGTGEADRALGTGLNLAANGEYYFSALVKRQGSFKFEFFYNASVNASDARWRFGALGDGTTNVALVGVSSDFQFTNVFPVNETVLVVAKMLARSATSPGDSVFLNVYRAGDTVPLAEPATWQATATQNSGVTLIRLRVRNIDNLPLEVDEIRVGRSWLEVVPGQLSGPPLITQQPQSMTLYEGGNATFSVVAGGNEPLFYQWSHAGTPIPNATNSVLLLTNVQAAQAGVYTVTVTNAAGSATSDPSVMLNVIAVTDVSVGRQALWHFDETTGLTAADATANGNHGTLLNFPGDDSQWIPSDYNGALHFSSNYVEVAHSDSLGADLANAFSVAAWIRSDVPLSTGGDTYRMLEKENSFFLLQGNNGALGTGGVSVLVKKGGANLAVGVGQALDANRWYHVAATFDGATVSIYLDGSLKGTLAVSAPIDTPAQPLHIGSDYNANPAAQKFLRGAMDEVGIWERALQPSEVAELSGFVGVPYLTVQPQPQSKYEGATAVFQVEAKGELPLRYLWFKGTEEIRSATSNVLVLLNVQASDAGEYHCRISNDLGDTDSDPATLTVIPVTGLGDGQAALWKFEETTGLTAADSSGQGRDGQLVDFTGDDSQWVAGQAGGALAFDGESNRVVVANSEAVDLGTDATFAFWINPTSFGTLVDHGNYFSHNSRVLHKGGHFSVEVVDDPGSVRATIRVNGVSAPQNVLALNVWQHFVAKYQGGNLVFFKNGFQLGDPVAATPGAVNTNQIVLGNISAGLDQTNFFHGAMDEVGIWLRPLNETEILELAGRDVAGAPVIITQPASATRYAGGTVTFMVEATGQRPLTYEWSHGGAPLLDSNTNRLVLTNLTVADGGNYTVAISNGQGATASTPPAVLTIQEITDVTTGLIGYWPMDETSGTVLNDASGRGHHATLVNSTAAALTGIIGGAFDFDGVGAFAIVPHAEDLNLFNQVSMSVWISPRSFGIAGSGGIGRILRKDINYDWTIYDPIDSMRFYGLNKATYDAPNGSVTLNEWQHVAVVIKDGTLQYFRNGRALAEPFPGLLGPTITNDLILGNYGPDLSINRLFNGYMDELGLWDRALSLEEIDGIYQNGQVGKPLNAAYEPFAVRTVDFPSATQVRLVFYSPYTGREHAVQRKAQLEDAEWTEEAAAFISPLGNGLFEATTDLPAGQSAFYRAVVLAQSALFTEDFETGAPGWTHGGAGDNWEVGAPVNGPGAAVSGANVYATSLTGNIEPFSNCYLRSPAIDLTGATRATLTFQQWLNIDPDPNFHWTTVSVLDAGSLTVLHQFPRESGATGGYVQRSLQLPAPVLGHNVILEFRLECDGFNLLEGWYLDDVQVLPE